MKDQARVVIVGGGIVGCSIAYHLSEMGWTDILVLERATLTSGSTFHAAGLVGQLRSSPNITRMLSYSATLYAQLEALTGQATEWQQVGGLKVASSKARWTALQREATLARSFGLPVELLSPNQALGLFPLMEREGIVGAVFLPTDGHVDPSGVTLALAKGAQQRGVEICEGINVTGFQISQGQVEAVVTDQGTIKTDVIVNAAGQWARDLGRLAGVLVPVQAIQHQYLVTDPIPELPRDLPTLRDPDNRVYFKEEAGAIVMGGYEHDPIPWGLEGIPQDFNSRLLKPNFDHFEPLATASFKRIPLLESIGVQKLINGPEAFTPDGHFIMGRAPELRNYFVAAGFNAHGIAAGGGAGKMLAEWIVAGEPSLDLWEVDIRRFGPHHRSTQFILDRSLESYSKHYAIPWPNDEPETARPLRCSPLYDLLKRQGACYGEKYGWERANWFAPTGVAPVEVQSWGRPASFDYVGNEHRAVREAVALFDQTPFAKFELRGPDALKVLNGLCANQMNKPVNTITYTQMCNQRGGIECDLTVTRTREDVFYIVTGTGFAVHDLDWIEKHLPQACAVAVTDVTSSRAVINVAGPKSRQLLQRIVAQDVSNARFPFGHCQTLMVGCAPVLALRISYVGELGYELHIPTEYAVYVYETLWSAGQALGLINAGYHAIESLRLEKGYRYWSKDITPDNHPYEAGLGFAVKLTQGDFLGHAALAKIKKQGSKRKLCCFTLQDQEAQIYGGEAIYYKDEIVGRVTSGGYGYTMAQCIVYGYVSDAGFMAVKGTVGGQESVSFDGFSVEVLGKSIAASYHSKTLYDPSNSRILC